MNRNYGIVWDQEIKEYKERNKYVKKPSTIDIVYDNEAYRSIFCSILNDMIWRSVTAEPAYNKNSIDSLFTPGTIPLQDISISMEKRA